MLEFLTEWGLEILLGSIIPAITAYFAAQQKKWKAQKQQYETMLAEKENEKAEHMIEEKLEPIYEELEDLRAYIRDTESIEKTHMALIIASYRFRLIQLCKEFLKQGYLTSAQYDQLSEFYRVYTGLGGNGQAQSYYERAALLPIHEPDEA